MSQFTLKGKSVSKLVEDEKKKQHRRKRHKAQHKKQKSLADDFDAANVVHVILEDNVQEILKCVVGVNVTAEKPWTYINKFFIQEQIESEDIPEDFKTFLVCKQSIIEFPNDEMLIGYIPDESREYDEFYLCPTVDVEEKVLRIVKEEEARQQARLENTICKRIGSWGTLGSEAEIEEDTLEGNRGLYRIVFEARYPLIYADVKFRFRLVSAARDGYAEMKMMPRYIVPLVNKKRIDNSSQIAPTVKINLSQTHCTYPRNNWTQYNYDCQFMSHLTKEFMEIWRRFRDNNMDFIDDNLCINSEINLYSTDYMALCNRPLANKYDFIYDEYNSINDVNICKDKMISAFTWHPLWTGVLAVAYANISPRWYHSGEKRLTHYMDEVINGFNPVLIWSLDDTLTRKLVLQTNCEVHCLAFCPHNENILVGGCANGEVVVWDIKNKLVKVETEEILTSSQQMYRARLFADMVWMKHSRDYSIVPPTALAQLQCTHTNNVTSIQWLHPLCKVSKTGSLVHIDEGDATPSLQFITGSSDGTVKFWDLHQTPLSTGDYKPQRKSRRLSKRPSALTLDVSPYRILNRRMIPHFQVNLLNDDGKTIPISHVRLPSDAISFKQKSSRTSQFSYTNRTYYEPMFQPHSEPLERRVVVGTYQGEFIVGNWEGFEYTSGDIFTKDTLKIANVGRYHDGPLLSIERHPIIADIYLTVGGKIFCIWMYGFTQAPVIWRKSTCRYTSGVWDLRNPSALRLTVSDGSREFWNFEYKSDAKFSAQIISGKPLMEAIIHPLPSGNLIIVAIADDRGTIRLMQRNQSGSQRSEDIESFQRFVDNNIQRRLDFETWQVNWTNKYASWITGQREAELAEAARKRAEQQAREAFEEEERAKETLEEEKRRAAKLHPPPGQYEAWAREQWIVNEQERMGNVILFNKRLDKTTLMKQQLPLKKLEIEEARKQQKIRQKLTKVDEIFNSTIAMLFPNLLAESRSTSVRVKDVFTDHELAEFDENTMKAYKHIVDESKDIIARNPFEYELDFMKILELNKTRKMKDDFKTIERHSLRYIKEKRIRDSSGDMETYFKNQDDSAPELTQDETLNQDSDIVF